ncbi:RNA polymerase sigma factor [Catenulispora pinisilvae]|uniref:RNA polymerase sigma factor n=1 Tax=Catenulispora pinisilvae TaxID=2705253 RepID=UPI0018918934|nr:hypothetical protein [Catenulispora pinisilvae]
MSCTNPVGFLAFEAKERSKALKYTAAWVGAEAAEDVVQDGLLVVWQKWDTLTNPAGYLYGSCKKLAFGEYEARDRGPKLHAELPEQPHLDDGQEEPGLDDAMLNLMVELSAQSWSSPRTAVVGLNLAEGYSKADIAQFLGLPLAEVHRSAAELRRYYRTRRADPKPTDPRDTYTPRGLVMRAMQRLSRRERQVMALAALGLKPSLIAPLIGITGGSARTTLCHARKSVIDTTGFLLEDEGISEVIDHFVKDSLGILELLGMLPDTPWKAVVLRHAVIEEERSFRVISGASRVGDRLSAVWKVIDDGPNSARLDHLLRAGWTLTTMDNLVALPPIGFYRPRAVVSYLTEISKVIAVVREGLDAGPAAAYGSVRWTHPGLRFRTVDHELRMHAAAFRRLQATQAPYLEDPVPTGNQKAAADPSAYSCPVPSWLAGPPRYLTLASPPGLEELRARRWRRKTALDKHRLQGRAELALTA